MANGFPPPALINWDVEYNEENLVGGGSHLAKITGMAAWLSTLPSRQDHDVVLMVDGHDIWFQLGPDVLIARYLDINRRADDRLARKLRLGASDVGRTRQSIIFGAQKRCWPRDQDDPACYAVPESTLPEHVYGASTDSNAGANAENPYRTFRPSYLNSGVIMGEVGSLRKLFVEAKKKTEEDKNFGSDQNIFAELFGQQELHRAYVACRNIGYWRKMLFFLGWHEKSCFKRHPTHRRQSERDVSGA